MERDFVSVLVIFNNQQFILSSVYFSPSDDLTDATTAYNHVRLKCLTVPHIIGGDFNAHNVIWGYRDTTPKGHEMKNFMASNNLHLHNSPGAQPTFDNSYHKGWPDLTLSTSDIVNNIYSWTVMDDESNSDHKYIHFLIQVDTSISILKRFKLPGGKIRHLHRILSETLRREEMELNTHNDQYDMNIYTDNLLTTLKDTCERILPIRTAKKLQGITWWTRQLRQMRQRCRALRRRLRTAVDGTETERLLTAFRQARATYKKAILEAKINSWRNFCTPAIAILTESCINWPRRKSSSRHKCQCSQGIYHKQLT
ncbi:uncharacterized protein LOC118183914 [Stegodyphus dumicola]|uniref:uncharacterized protein LOC118183914 n=1 Tax=Stegodyphus dumicola TaxID=202533 RepID=UPI0015AA74FB|nr:uncharacterized protein LOC118183914 [Stegodyphus dumicola]